MISIEQIQNKIKDFVASVEKTEAIDNLIQFKVDEIIQNGQTHGRSRERLTSHVTTGYVLEEGVKSFFPQAVSNPKQFDHTDRDSYAWDVEIDGSKFEIKHSRKSTWVNFNLKEDDYANDHLYTAPNLQTAFNNRDILDYVMIGEVEDCGDHWDVEFYFVCEFDEFVGNAKASRRTSSGYGTTHYFNTHTADPKKYWKNS